MSEPPIRYGLLGPVTLWAGDRPVPLGGPKQQALLATLLLQANRVVPMHELTGAVWGDGPPASATTQIRNRVSTLRRLLHDSGAGREIVGTEGTGYVLRTDSGQLDVADFERQVGQAEQLLGAGHRERALTRLSDALALWRGPALDGLPEGALESAARRLDERRLAVLSQRLELELALGRHEHAIAELTELVRTRPWNERLVALLMSALYAVDRRQEALECFELIRRRLADELGVDPGVHLSELRKRILRDDPELRAGEKPGRATAVSCCPAAPSTRRGCGRYCRAATQPCWSRAGAAPSTPRVCGASDSGRCPWTGPSS